jgi:oligopeptide/dipeptide ABC transporter ATP-binding protein
MDPGGLLRVSGLVTAFFGEDGEVRAVNGVDLDVRRGEVVAVVGESGSGKSVTSLSVMRLIRAPAGRIVGGRILFRTREGAVVDLATLDERAMRALRGDQVAMIFQEPMSSLNPVHPVGRQIAEAIRLHRGIGRAEARRQAIDLLDLVEIPDAARRVDAFPHQLSGGMRQRVMIAMALACRPALLIADEPTTALDVTIQAQILALLKRLQAELGMGILFITHNLGVVAEIADRVVVMYGGRIVESGTIEDLFERPRHPYTRGLHASVPQRGRHGRLAAIPGRVVDPRRPPPGCAFAPRCAHRIPECEAAVPPLETVAGEQAVRCIRWREL